jgi:hypothetical protein
VADDRSVRRRNENTRGQASAPHPQVSAASNARLSYSVLVTAAEAYDLTTRGGTGDFAQVIAGCETFPPYCLIGGLAVNCYVEPVYTLDADIVAISQQLPPLLARLQEQGFKLEAHTHSVNAQASDSDLRIQFTTDERYQSFLSRSEKREVFGLIVSVACLEDVVRGKLWAYDDGQRRLSKRKKDELDLIRLAEAHPELKSLYPRELLELLRGA